MTTTSKANREYKDTVFTLLFGDIALELYCAITGKSYDRNSVTLDMTTLTDALIRGRLNDLAFILDGRLVVLIEHQSSINENMALRMLFYIARIYEKYIDAVYGKGAIYREKMLKIPRPEFIVLYNGKKEMPNGDRYTMKLSDMFAKLFPSDEPFMGGLDLTVEIFNINKGRNPDMAARCRELDEYETFIQKIRNNEAAEMPLKEAVEKAVLECLEKGILKDFLNNHKWEVTNMLTTEWNFADEIAVARLEEREIAREEERKNFARFLLKKGGMSVDEISEATKLDVNTILHLQGE